MKKRLMEFLCNKSFVVFAVICYCLFFPQLSFAYVSPGSPVGYVNDFAGIFTVEQKNVLEDTLRAFNASTTNEIAVVIISSLGEDYVEHYSVELFKEWGIGTRKNDNGVLLLVAVDDRKMRIEVGYGLEGSLTDALSSQIIRSDLTPAFKRGDFYGGISTAVTHIIDVTKGEYVHEADTTSGKLPSISLGAIMFHVVIIVQFLSAILARSKSWWAGGIVGAVAGIVITFFGIFGVSFVVGFLVTTILVFLGLVFDYIVSSRYAHAVSLGSTIPWWIGGRGGSGGSSRSRSSFGGFSGGSSGGGGASGSW